MVGQFGEVDHVVTNSVLFFYSKNEYGMSVVYLTMLVTCHWSMCLIL